MQTANGDSLVYLVDTKDYLRGAGVSVAQARAGLGGSRLARLDELAEMIARAESHADRLAACIEGDIRAEIGGTR
jgi:hypothetical protein